MLSNYIIEFQSWAQGVALNWGYLGIFIISVIGSASIVFPLPTIFIVFLFASMLNPLLLGIVAGFGSALGELTGYVLGRGGRKVVRTKKSKWLEKSERWSKKHGIFPVIILFSATPLPDDVIGIIAGLIDYDVKKFLLSCSIGKIILNIIVAYAGFYGINWVLTVFGS